MKYSRIISISLILTIAMLALACSTGLLTTLGNVLGSAAPVVDSFAAAGSVSATEGANLKSDFGTFSTDVRAIKVAVDSKDKAAEAVTIERLVSHVARAAPDFHLGNPAASPRFAEIYSIIDGLGQSLALFYRVPQPASAHPRAGRPPSEAEIKAQIEKLKELLK